MIDTLRAEGMTGQVEVSNGVITITRQGVRATLSQGKKGEQAIPVNRVTRVDYKKPTLLVNGHIHFLLKGEEEHGSLNCPRTVIFRKHEDEFEKIAELVNKLKDEMQRGRKPEDDTQTAPDAGRPQEGMIMTKQDMVLPDKVKEAVGDRKVIGFVTGFGVFQQLTATIVLTEAEVIFFDPKLGGADRTEIPFAQIVSAAYVLNMGVPLFSVTTQSGTQELVLKGSKKDAHEPALALFNHLREKLSQLASVPISETHNKGIMKEVWSFYAPPQLAVMGTRTQGSRISESIPDQIRKLAELRDAGILTPEEFEKKKTELLGRM
jgi:hypothetical protein